MSKYVGVFGCVEPDHSEAWLETRSVKWLKADDGSTTPLFQENDGSYHKNIDTDTRSFLQIIEKIKWKTDPTMANLWDQCLNFYGLEEIIEPNL